MAGHLVTAFENFMASDPICLLQYGDGPIVATLGDTLASTCSVDVASRWAKPQNGSVAGYGSFEDAARALAGLSEISAMTSV